MKRSQECQRKQNELYIMTQETTPTRQTGPMQLDTKCISTFSLLFNTMISLLGSPACHLDDHVADAHGDIAIWYLTDRFEDWPFQGGVLLASDTIWHDHCRSSMGGL